MSVQRKVIGVDHYNWSEPIEGSPRRQRRSAVRGDIIEVSEEEAKRGEELGALGDVDDSVEEPVSEFVPASDDDINDMTVEQVTAYLGTVPETQSDDEVARVLELEEQRGKPRAGVLSLGEDPADDNE
jgi:hypothetical protein